MTLGEALQRAIHAHQSGQWQAAESLYRSILASNPGHADANHNLGVLATQVGRPDAALPFLRAALAADDSSEQFWLSLIRALVKLADWEEAAQMLAQARAKGLSGSSLIDLEVQCRAAGHPRSQRPKEDALPQASLPPAGGSQEPAVPAPEPVKAAGRLSVDIQRFGVLLAQSELEAATELALAITQYQPAQGLGWKALGAVHMRAGRAQDALPALRKAVSLLPKDPECHLNLGVCLLELRREAEAEREIRLAIKTKPRYSGAHLRLGEVLLATGRPDAAADAYRSALRHEPDLAGAHLGLAQVMKAQGALSEARQHLDKAMSLDPSEAQVHFQLGHLLQSQQLWEDSLRSYERCLALDSRLVEAHFNKGLVERITGRTAQAEASFRQALDLQPDYTPALSNLGRLLMDVGRLEESLTCLRRQVEIAPDSADAQHGLGSVLQALGRHEEAETCFRKALAADPRHAGSLSNLGITQQELGRLSEAVLSFQSALQLQPDSASTLVNLAHTLSDLDELPRAIEAYRLAWQQNADEPGQTAAIYSAAWAYLAGDRQLCRELLDRSIAFEQDPRNRFKSARSYWGYLDRLLAWHAAASDKEHSSPEMPVLHVIGESHSLATHGMTVRTHGTSYRCEAHWMPGCKQWHLANGTDNKYKRKFEKIMARLPPKSRILLTIGEIDCRHEEGILKASRRSPDLRLEDIVARTVDGYLRFVEDHARRHGHRVIVCGVPSPYRQLSQGVTAEMNTLVEVIRQLNLKCQGEALARGLDFLDVRTLTDAGQGRADGQWHIDDIHLRPDAVAVAFDRCFMAAGQSI